MSRILTFIAGIAVGAIYHKEIKEAFDAIKAQQTEKIAKQAAQQVAQQITRPINPDDDIEDVF